MSIERETIQLAGLVASADTPAESLDLFVAFQKPLEGWRFLIGSDKGNIPGHAVNRTFKNGVVRSLFAKDKVLFLDERTVRDMYASRPIPFDFSIGLDTQALSYLEPYLGGGRVPEGFEEVFRFLALPEVNVDPMPYLLENSPNLGDARKAEKIFEKLRAYQILRTIDASHLERSGAVQSTLTKADLYAETQRFLSRQMYDLSDAPLTREKQRRHKLFYCLLLKMAELQIGSKKSPDKKVEEFLEFLDRDMACIMAREALLARRLFERGQKFKFFGRVMKKYADLFAALKNMAWDLHHIRQCEESLSLLPEPSARYFLQAIMTFDVDLIEVIDSYPLRSCAIAPSGEVFPFYVGDFFEELVGGIAEKDRIAERFFSPEAIADRVERRDGCQARLDNMIAELEASVASVATIPMPVA